MCGIFGIYSSTPLTDSDLTLVNSSEDYLKHRGPDQFNIKKINQNLIFSHSRLSIIDLSDENYQPRKEGEAVLSFNGEIYNFKDLKKTYLKSERFHTNGDTEVLLKMWKKHGKKCLDYLDGMYAFSIWDGNTLHLVTDKFSEKPLFLLKDENKIIFSSEQKIFYQLFKNEISEKDTKFFDFMGIQINEESLCKKIKKLKPSNIVSIKNGKITSDEIYEINNPTKTKSKIENFSNQNIEEILELLLKSINKRLISDQRVSILQSGGYDSTLLLALIKNEIKKDFQCYHLEQKNFSEREQIISNFKKLNIPLDYIKFVQFNEEYIDINNVVDYHYQLTDNFAISLLDCICKTIQDDKIRVALTGTGGDELFYGYSKYFNAYKIQQKFQIFNNKFFEKISNYLPDENLIKILNKKDLNIISYLKNKDMYKFYIKNNKEISFPKIFKLNKSNLFENMREFDLNFTLPENLNFNQDIASMKNSVEIRSPYLNKDLFNYINNINPKILFQKGPKTLSKIILEKYFKLNISKKGFTFSKDLQNNFQRLNHESIEKYNLKMFFKANFQLGFKNLYKKKLINKIKSL